MKNILVMRHAKSDWANNSPDIERPLNNRGKKAAPFMGKELIKRNKKPDIILSSPAKRAICTSEKVIESIDYQKELITVKDFYFGHMKNIIATIKTIDNDVKLAMIVGHNPIWEDLILSLLQKKDYIAMPTAAIASLVFDINDWQMIKENSAELEWIITPKGLNVE